MSDKVDVSSTGKRQQGDSNDQQLKRPKTGILRESNVVPTKAMDITEENLMCLSFDELLNLARTDEQSRSVVDLVFAQKFGKKKLILNIDDCQRCDEDLKVKQNSVEIKDLEVALGVLRHFGHLITELVVGTSYRVEVWRKVHCYASKYCSESLKEISFIGISKIGFEVLENSFSNAEKVGLTSCILGDKTPLNIWFPKVRFLKICNSKIALECIAVHLPQLEHLFIDRLTSTTPRSMLTPIASLTSTQSTCIPNIVGLLRLNPQIRNLVLHTQNSIEILRGVNHKWQALEQLDINCCTGDFLYLNGAVIEFERLRQLRINFSGFTREMVPRIPISPKRLEVLTWSFCFYGKDNNLIDFIKKNPFIVKLNFVHRVEELSLDFRNKMHVIKKDCTKMAKALPSLQEVSFSNIVLPAKNIIPFTSNCKALKKIQFNVADHAQFHYLTKNLDNHWKVSMDYGYRVELERKA